LSKKEAQSIVNENEKLSVQNDKLVLDELADKLENIIKGFPNGAMVRLSTRSPKDAIQHTSKFKQTFAEELSKIEGIDYNVDDILWYSSNVHSMCLLSGKEAVDLLVASYRVHDDLARWIEFPDFDMNIIIRAWEYIHPSMEFRCFVHQGQLTAVSQYITTCYFTNLVALKQKIREQISQFFNSVKSTLETLYQSYVFDIAILPNGAPIIIEVNPFWDKTGPALFHWEEDRDVIAGSLASFEFRIADVEWMRKRNYSFNVRDNFENTTRIE